MPLVLAIVVLAAAACGGDESNSGSATMKPGENCLSCHQFTLAGTVYAADTLQGASGVDVAVTDQTTVVRHYTTNSVGNFYTTDAMSFPVGVSVSRGPTSSSMANASSGACNACHDASMRITVP